MTRRPAAQQAAYGSLRGNYRVCSLRISKVAVAFMRPGENKPSPNGKQFVVRLKFLGVEFLAFSHVENAAEGLPEFALE